MDDLRNLKPLVRKDHVQLATETRGEVVLQCLSVIRRRNKSPNIGIPFEQTWSPMRDISIDALQFEHLIEGKKLDERVNESMTAASSPPCSSQPKDFEPRVRTCSNAAIRIYSAFNPNFMRTSTSSYIARAAQNNKAGCRGKLDKMYI